MWNSGPVGSVQSVERAFLVLRCLAGGPAGVTEIAECCDLPKSTVSRLLTTLNEIDVVEQMGAGGDYRIGTAILDLAGGISPTAHLVALARPHLTDLSEELGEATGISVLDGRQVHYLDQVDGPHAVQVRDWTGERVPAHLVPSGIVLLAAAGPDELDRYLDRPLEATTAKSMTDRRELRERLERVAATGVEWVYEEFADGINSVGAAVRDRGGAAVAAVHAHGPSYRFPGERSVDEIGKLVIAAADRISDRIAW
jgi:DNA-binding IclR family transcriptional regulator